VRTDLAPRTRNPIGAAIFNKVVTSNILFDKFDNYKTKNIEKNIEEKAMSKFLWQSNDQLTVQSLEFNEYIHTALDNTSQSRTTAVKALLVINQNDQHILEGNVASLLDKVFPNNEAFYCRTIELQKWSKTV